MDKAELVKENARLQAENARLKREIEIEERVTLRWKALAGVFHDTLWSALRRYDPPVYEKLRKEKKTGQTYCSEENKSVQSTFLRMGVGVPQEKKSRQQSVPAVQKEEGERLQAENHKLQSALAGQREAHKKWEQMAVCFHDTLWQVLLKYEPDTYGPLYPERKTDTEPDYSQLPLIKKTE